MTDFIESSQNSKFKNWLRLLKPSGIKKQNQFIVFGEKIIHDYLKLKQNSPVCYLTENEIQTEIPQFVLSKNLFNDLDIFGTHKPILVAEAPQLASLDEAPMFKEGIRLYCALSDPSNLGALLRSALSFGVSEVVLLEESAHPLHPKCIRSSSGALFSLNLYSGPSINSLPSKIDYIGLDAKGAPLDKNYRWPRQTHLLLGEEGQGLPKNMSLNTLAIPISSDMESLNATVAASISLYHWSLK